MFKEEFNYIATGKKRSTIRLGKITKSDFALLSSAVVNIGFPEEKDLTIKFKHCVYKRIEDFTETDAIDYGVENLEHLLSKIFDQYRWVPLKKRSQIMSILYFELIK